MSDEKEVVRVPMPHDDQMFGIVKRSLGNYRVEVACMDGNVRMGRIPGKMRKRNWIREGDVVIVKPWDVQGDEKCDIEYRYRKSQAQWLKKNGYLDLDKLK